MSKILRVPAVIVIVTGHLHASYVHVRVHMSVTLCYDACIIGQFDLLVALPQNRNATESALNRELTELSRCFRSLFLTCHIVMRFPQ